MAQGNWVQGTGSYGKYCWCAYVDVAEVRRTDVTVTYRVTHGYGTRYAINCYANGSSSAGGSWSGSVYSTNNSGWVWVQCTSRDVTLNRGSGSAYNHTFTGQINVTGGFGNGTSNASNTVTVPCRAYSVPRPPKNLTAERLSDSSAKIEWEGDYTGMDGAYPWSTVKPAKATDGGAMTDIAEVGWNQKSYTCNSLEPGHRYEFAARAVGHGGTSAYSNTAVVYTTPTALGALTASKSGAGRVVLEGRDAPAYVDSWEFQRTSDAGATWGDVALTEAWEDESAPAGTIAYRARAVKAGLAGPWCESNPVTTICPPLAPSLRGLGGALPTGSTLSVSWVPNHPDGSAQSAAQVEVTDPSGAVSTVDVAGASASVGVSLASKGVWSVRVRTKGVDPGWGEWSGASVVRVADAPQAYFTTPAADGDKVVKMPVMAAWRVADETGVAWQQLRLYDHGLPLWTATVQPTARYFPLNYGMATFVNHHDYEVELTVRAGSGLTVTARRTFTIEWTPPAVPQLDVHTDPLLGCHVSPFPGTGAGGEPAPEYFTVQRVLPDGSTLALGGRLTAGQTASDPLPPLNTDYVYAVTAYAASGSTSTAEVPARVDSDAVAFSFGRAAETGWLGRRVLEGSSRAVRHTRELIHFAGSDGGLPVSYGLDEKEAEDKLSFRLIGVEEFLTFSRVMEDEDRCWVRDREGGRQRAVIDCDTKREKGGASWKASVDVTRCEWEEPVSG